MAGRSTVLVASVLSALVASGVVGGLGVRAMANAAAAANAPTVVATVDIERLLNNAAEYKQRNVKFEASKDDMQKQLDALKAKIEKFKKALDEAPDNDFEQKIQIAGQLNQAEAEAAAMAQFANKRLALDAGILNSELYRKAMATIEKYAGDNGYDLVVLDDSTLKVPSTAAINVVGDVISRRRVLFAKKQIDITDAILTAMDNDFASGRNPIKAAEKPPEKPKDKPKAKKN